MTTTSTFFDIQSQEQKDLYVKLLQITGSLSNLFADSSVPFLYYRAMENIFCKAFDADNYARSDISADAGKNKVGVGLKTFLHNNGMTFQKVAEFNRDSSSFRDLDAESLVEQVALARNERIEMTKRTCELDDMIYHVITRRDGQMTVYEEHMDLVDISNIRNIQEKATTVHFTDGIHDYSFSKSKSTLLKRFHTPTTSPLLGFPVSILDDPFDFLLGRTPSTTTPTLALPPDEEVEDLIVLPLYQIQGKEKGEVAAKSGLNQWAAGGRLRDPDEVYIPVPKWIHSAKPNFFTYNTDDNKTAPFDVTLPSGKTLSMRIAQQGGKALMSNPNKAVGKWLLRDVLNLPARTPVTRKLLDKVGIDSVKLSKMADGSYALDFLKPGSYEAFEANNRA